MKNILVLGATGDVNWADSIEVAFASSGNNFGNLLIGDGVRSVLSVNRLRKWSEFGSPEEANEICDHVVIGAANFLWKGFDLSYLADIVEPLQMPVTIMGVGAQTQDRSRVAEVHPGTIRLMKIVSERSKSIGARGFYTAEVLASLGIHNITITGCPSLYADKNRDIKIRSSHADLFENTVVNFSRRVVGHSFDPILMRHVENQLLKMALEKRALFIAQDELEEISISENRLKSRAVTEYFSESSDSSVFNYFQESTKYFKNVSRWKEVVKSASVVVGTRLHGAIAGLTSGVPAFLIAHDSRTLEVATAFQLPFINLQDFGNCEVEKLKQLVCDTDYSVFSNNYSVFYDRFCDFLDLNNLDHDLR